MSSPATLLCGLGNKYVRDVHAFRVGYTIHFDFVRGGFKLTIVRYTTQSWRYIWKSWLTSSRSNMFSIIVPAMDASVEKRLDAVPLRAKFFNSHRPGYGHRPRFWQKSNRSTVWTPNHPKRVSFRFSGTLVAEKWPKMTNFWKISKNWFLILPPHGLSYQDDLI